MMRTKWLAPGVALVTCMALTSGSFAANLSNKEHGPQSGALALAQSAQDPGYHPDCWPASVAAVAGAVVAAAVVVQAVVAVVHETRRPTLQTVHLGNGVLWHTALSTAANAAFDRQ